MKDNLNLKFAFFFLFLAYLFAVYLRTHLSKNPDYYNPKDPTAYYWTENALQYHYAELIAEGKPIPEFDKNLQAPEGVALFENLTILMEYPCGWLYRGLGLKAYGIFFHTWTILYIALVSSTMIFATYFISRALTLNPYHSLLSGILSLFSIAGIGRSIFGFLNEDFALPFIFFGIGFFILALRKKKNFILPGFISGLFLGIALACWHFTRFVLLAIVFCNLLNIWFFTLDSEQRERNGLILFSFLLLPLVFSLFIPVLKKQHFYLSIPISLGIGASMGVLLFGYPEKKIMPLSLKGRLGILVGILFLLISILIARFYPEGEYHHVWSLFFNKLKYLGIKPDKPSFLDYPARSLWIEAFNSPHPVTFLKDVFPLIIPAVFGFIYLIKKRGDDSSARLFIFLSLLFFLLYLAIERLIILTNSFIAILSVLFFFKNSRRVFLSSLPFIILGFNFYQVYNFHHPTIYLKTLRKVFGNEKDILLYHLRINDVELVRYIKHRTPSDANFLSRFCVGPLILAYAQRPIALQPKFEVRNCQKRVKEYLEAVYSTEDRLYELCQKWKVRYFLYDIKIALDNTHDADRWVSDNMQLPKNSVAFLMHFFPERLNHFQLVYQNNFYRLYEVLPQEQSPYIPDFPYQPIYDINQFGNQDDAYFFDDRFTRRVSKEIKKAKDLLKIGTEMLVSNPYSAVGYLERSRMIYPSLISSATTLGIAYVLIGKVDEGLNLCQEEIRVNPLLPLAHYNLAFAYIAKNNLPEGRRELLLALELDPNFTEARELLNQLGE